MERNPFASFTLLLVTHRVTSTLLFWEDLPYKWAKMHVRGVSDKPKILTLKKTYYGIEWYINDVTWPSDKPVMDVETDVLSP